MEIPKREILCSINSIFYPLNFKTLISTFKYGPLQMKSLKGYYMRLRIMDKRNITETFLEIGKTQTKSAFNGF